MAITRAYIEDIYALVLQGSLLPETALHKLLIASLSHQERNLYMLVATTPGINTTELASAMKITPEHVGAIVCRMSRSGLIRVDKNIRPHQYRALHPVESEYNQE